MRIIISPALKMKGEEDFFPVNRQPVFAKEAGVLADGLKTLSVKELQDLLVCNAQIADQSYQRYQQMQSSGSLPALFAFEGIQYKYMAPRVFDEGAYGYLEEHLRILSGLYGVLRPFDGISPYRLEMQARYRTEFCRSLYDFWGDKIYRSLAEETNTIVNLASKEYSRVIEPYCTEAVRFITCRFLDRKGAGWIEKSVYVKMARGAMVRFMAEHRITDVKQLKNYREFGYRFVEELSDDHTFVYTKE